MRILVLVSAIPAVVAAASLPEAPDGYRWEVDPSLSDEFEGTTLDRTKWIDHLPGWEGRPPGKFMPESVVVRDGSLQISLTSMSEPDGDFTIAAGAVQSTTARAHFGYHEARIKASPLSASSNFWFFSDVLAEGETEQKFELIVQMGIGESADHSHHMKSNAMMASRPREGTAKWTKAKRTDRAALRSGIADEFHTYGCWWVDANTIRFYADGEHVYTIHPATDFDEAPFRHPLFVSFVCETFDWQPIPTGEDLADPDRNTAYIDYLRSYRLVKDQ